MDIEATLEILDIKIDQTQAVMKALKDILFELEWKPERNHVPNLADVVTDYLEEISDLVLNARSDMIKGK